MAQIVKIRLPDGRVLVPSDWTSAEPLYSTVEVKAGPYTTLSAFAYGIGGEVPGSIGNRRSQITDTNLEGEGARIPANEELIIYSINVEAFQIGNQNAVPDALNPDAPFTSLDNILRLQRDLILVTWLANVREYTSHPMGWFPAGMGTTLVNAGSQTAAAAPYVAATSGSASVDGKRLIASPLYVNGGESLRLDFVAPKGEVENLDEQTTVPPGLTDGRVRLRTYLDGFRRRPVA
jgi:hypothetical protein